MPTIKSIIIFNGGSCGDFLQAVCLEQIYQQSTHVLYNNNSTIQVKNQYFKHFCGDTYHKNTTDKLDFSKTFPVENSHYYLDFFADSNSQLFYIDYPDSAQGLITQCYLEKRMSNSVEKFYNEHIKHIPQTLQHKIDPLNIVNAFDVQNKKNLTLWRHNPQMRSIPISSLFDIELLIPVVETVCQQPLANVDMLQTTQTQWVNANPALNNFFKP